MLRRQVGLVSEVALTSVAATKASSITSTSTAPYALFHSLTRHLPRPTTSSLSPRSTSITNSSSFVARPFVTDSSTSNVSSDGIPSISTSAPSLEDLSYAMTEDGERAQAQVGEEIDLGGVGRPVPISEALRTVFDIKHSDTLDDAVLLFKAWGITAARVPRLRQLMDELMGIYSNEHSIRAFKELAGYKKWHYYRLPSDTQLIPEAPGKYPNALKNLVLRNPFLLHSISECKFPFSKFESLTGVNPYYVLVHCPMLLDLKPNRLRANITYLQQVR